MAELFKATFFLEYTRGGYSFSLYRMEADYEKMILSAQSLAEKYMPLLGSGVVMPYIRVSRDDIPGDARISTKRLATLGANDTDPTAQQKFKPAVDGPPDPWWTALLLRLGASPTVWGHQFLRLIPDSVIELPGGLIDIPAYSAALLAYFTKLCGADQWGMKGLPRGVGFRKQITNVVSAGGADVEITTNGNHNFVSGSKVKISGMTPKSSTLNGEWQITVGGDTTKFSLNGSAGFILPKIQNYGTCWSLTKQFVPFVIDLCTYVRVTSRQTGRPFDSLVGRRRKP